MYDTQCIKEKYSLIATFLFNARSLVQFLCQFVTFFSVMMNAPEQIVAEGTGKAAYWKTWKLHTDKGRQYWEFIPPDHLKALIQTDEDWEKPEAQKFLKQWAAAYRFNPEQNPNSSDAVFRYLATAAGRNHQYIDRPAATTLKEEVKNAAGKGFDFYRQLQTDDGNWPGDYGGPLFLTPGIIIASYVTHTPFPAPYRELMKVYFLNHQHKDGGWGLHIEDQSTMFGTVLQYVALRLLGAGPDMPEMQKARKWIHENGGATFVPSWGKFYLALLGVYEWKGCNSLFPELWLLPRSLAVHPSHYWCHSRLVFLPMSYCYAHRIKADETELTAALREELYPVAYSSVNWKKARYQCHSSDQYYPISGLYKMFQGFINGYEKIHSKKIRNKALKFALDYMQAEDEQTNYINIGPVNQAINSVCIWHAYGKNADRFRQHAERWFDFLWVAEDGIKMNGYNGSQLWDTCFAGQALIENKLENELPSVARGIYHYLDITQAREHVVKSKEFFRSASKGSWPFSTAEQAWPVTDCTAEAMKTALMMHHTGVLTADEKKISRDRLLPAVDMLLAYQNQSGGWASYEEIRGPEWLELLNPAEIFGEIMTEHAYVECSSATIQGLTKFINEYPDYRYEEIQKAIARGKNFIASIQRDDGSWYGSWAVCFTYGTWFGIEGLMAAGEQGYYSDAPSYRIKKACEFLVSIQREDGSWGESYRSSVEKKYIPHETGQIINTAWAVMGLLRAGYPDHHTIRKGIRFILDHQQENGDWPQQAISGVFNHNCMITYTAYRNVFPLMALGRFLHSEATGS